jgi:hypothetical protein
MPKSKSRLTEPPADDRIARQRQEAEQRARKFRAARRREEIGEAFTYLALFVLSFAFVAAAWLLMRHEQSRPRELPTRLQYASTDERTVRYSLEFDSPGALPSGMQASAQSTILPKLVVNRSPDQVRLSASTTPLQLPIEVVVPAGTQPGNYRGTLRFRDAGGLVLRQLVVNFTVADPMALVRETSVIAGLMLVVGYLFMVWRRPAPGGRLLTLQVSPYGQNRTPDPSGKALRRNWFRAWIWLPGRNRVPLRRIDSGLPDGELVFERTGLKRLRMKAMIRCKPEQGVYQLRGWPRDTGYAQNSAPAPEQISVDFPARISGPVPVIALAPDSGGRSLTFSFEHPQTKKS